MHRNPISINNNKDNFDVLNENLGINDEIEILESLITKVKDVSVSDISCKLKNLLHSLESNYHRDLGNSSEFDKFRKGVNKKMFGLSEDINCIYRQCNRRREL